MEDAINAYCEKFNSEIKVYDGEIEDVPLSPGEKKYFYYKSNDPKFGEFLVDIHIIRANGEEVCFKQDLTVKLMDGDFINIGMLAC
ncbi:hypothetical protein [Pleionea sediminis]|uniref:hypothetical protein n=1 Tax=Pleionea sediminis TaxID=2569479 RepID=UPI001185B97D|nr:hypothetical protein [Pleionea sediminis]